MISVLIPVYNQADKIKTCLETIKNQTVQDFEIIIVNDGSKDNIEEVMEDCKGMFTKKLTFITQVNQGAPAARNRAWKEATGDYLLFSDADLKMEPTMFEEMLKALKENPEASYAYCSHMFGEKLFKFWPFSADKLREIPYVHSTSLIRAKDFPETGWDITFKKFQDWDLFLTMLDNGKTGVWIDKVLFKIETGGTMSGWLPAVAYRLFPFLPKVKIYQQWMAIIKKKHNIKF